MACSCVAAAFIAKCFKKGKLEIEIMLNATLAGGVAMGSSADIITQPFGAMLLGFLAGAISAFGFAKITPFVRAKLGLHDTCGVLYLHCIPGIIGAIVSAIVSDLSDESFGENYHVIFLKEGRTARQQAGFQLAGLGVTIGIALLSGIFGGFIASRSWFQPPKELFEDTEHWYDKEIIQDHQFELDRNETYRQQSMMKEKESAFQTEENHFVEKKQVHPHPTKKE